MRTSSCNAFMRSIARTLANRVLVSNGLVKYSSAPASRPGHDLPFVALSGQHDHGNKRQRGVGLQALDRFYAIETRHHHVEQNKVRQMRTDLIERLETVDGGDHVVALALEAQADVFDVVRRIVDDQNERTLSDDLFPLSFAVHRRTYQPLQ